jgi:ArsR family metal-binding transcriptional regulator
VYSEKGRYLKKIGTIFMLLTNYKKEIFRAECNPEFQSVHLKAYLSDNIEKVLPYLNTALGGFAYYRDPQAVTFKNNGRLITVQGNEIAINALKDIDEANKVIRWLVDEINNTWENKDSIEPSYTSSPKPKIIDILKYLPKTNCKKCNVPTCMVFATRVVEGIYSGDNCPELKPEIKTQLDEYLSHFSFED